MKKLIILTLILTLTLSSVSALSFEEIFTGNLGKLITGKATLRTCTDYDNGKDNQIASYVQGTGDKGEAFEYLDVCTPYDRKKNLWGWSKWKVFGKQSSTRTSYATNGVAVCFTGKQSADLASGVGHRLYINNQISADDESPYTHKYACKVRERFCTEGRKPLRPGTETHTCAFGCAQMDVNGKQVARCLTEKELSGIQEGKINPSDLSPGTQVQPQKKQEPKKEVPGAPAPRKSTKEKTLPGTSKTIGDCTDSDGGINPQNPGYISIKNYGKQLDTCKENILNEMYCTENGEQAYKSIICKEPCKKQWVDTSYNFLEKESPPYIALGYCQTETVQQECMDNDNTNIANPQDTSYFIPSSVTFNSQEAKDKCIIRRTGWFTKTTNQYVREAYCENGVTRTKQVLCQYGCETNAQGKGACKTETMICGDNICSEKERRSCPQDCAEKAPEKQEREEYVLPPVPAEKPVPVIIRPGIGTYLPATEPTSAIKEPAQPKQGNAYFGTGKILLSIDCSNIGATGTCTTKSDTHPNGIRAWKSKSGNTQWFIVYDNNGKLIEISARDAYMKQEKGKLLITYFDNAVIPTTHKQESTGKTLKADLIYNIQTNTLVPAENTITFRIRTSSPYSAKCLRDGACNDINVYEGTNINRCISKERGKWSYCDYINRLFGYIIDDSTGTVSVMANR